MNLLDGTGETFVLLWIVILQTNLNFHSLQEVPFVGFGFSDDGIYTLIKCITRHLRPKIISQINSHIFDLLIFTHNFKMETEIFKKLEDLKYVRHF